VTGKKNPNTQVWAQAISSGKDNLGKNCSLLLCNISTTSLFLR
jgi:hypothetical protein